MDYHRINTQGKIWIQRVDDVDVVAVDEGGLLYSRSNDEIYIGTSTEWLSLSTKYSVLTAGSKLLFGSYPIPTGWNITSYNDVIVHLTDTSGSVGSLAGAWKITGFGSGGSHDHGGNTSTPDNIYASWGDNNPDYVLNIPTCSTFHGHTISSVGNHSHTFDGAWRPRSVKFCEAEMG